MGYKEREVFHKKTQNILKYGFIICKRSALKKLNQCKNKKFKACNRAKKLEKNKPYLDVQFGPLILALISWISWSGYLLRIAIFLQWFSFFNALLLNTIKPYIMTTNILVPASAEIFSEGKPPNLKHLFTKKNSVYLLLCIKTTQKQFRLIKKWKGLFSPLPKCTTQFVSTHRVYFWYTALLIAAS